MDPIFRDPPELDEAAAKKFLVADRAEALAAVAAAWGALDDFSAPAIEASFVKLLEEKGLEMKVVAQPVRVALTGRTASPGLYEVAALLGKDRTVARLEAAAARARG
jgi:glutamyl-tRNA synthetase